MRLCRLLAPLVLVITSPSLSSAQSCAQAPADWVFCEDFENGIGSAWLDKSNLQITSVAQNVNSGAAALEIIAHKGQDNGGGGKLDLTPGADTLHLRFFVKLSSNFGYLHHFVQMGGRAVGKGVWFPFGSAGCKPSGANFFVSGLELDGGFSGGTTPKIAIPGRWTFYTYYMDMTGWGTGTATCIQTCADCVATRDALPCNDTCFHGNLFAPSPDQIPQLGTWYCMEMAITLNTGTSANGSQAMWMNGTKLGEWNNLRWRTDPTLNINAVLVQNYTTGDHFYAPGQTSQTVWFDDIVVSKSYIGCSTSGPVKADSGPVQADSGPVKADSGPTTADSSTSYDDMAAAVDGASATADATGPNDCGGQCGTSDGVLASGPDRGGPRQLEGGCGCRLWGRPQTLPGLAVALVLVVLVLRRRRRRD